MKVAGLALTTLALLFAVGCNDGDDKDRSSAQDQRVETNNNGDKNGDERPPTGTDDDMQPSSAVVDDEKTGGTDLPAGVKENPADELPKPDSKGKDE